MASAAGVLKGMLWMRRVGIGLDDVVGGKFVYLDAMFVIWVACL